MFIVNKVISFLNKLINKKKVMSDIEDFTFESWSHYPIERKNKYIKIYKNGIINKKKSNLIRKKYGYIKCIIK